MATGDIVRRVLIQTEVEHVGSTGRAGSPMGGSSRPAGVRRPAGVISRGGRSSTAGVSQASRNNFRQRSKMLDELARKERQMHREKMRGLERESRVRRQIDNIRPGRAFNPNTEANMRSLSGQRMSSSQSRVDYFSTGNASLDALNRRGFQAFITMMTARMIGQAVKGGLGFGAGLGSGEGQGLGAQINRIIRGRISPQDEESGIFGWGRRTGRGLLNLSMMPFMGAGERGRFIEEIGYGAPPGQLTAADLARRQHRAQGGATFAGMALSSAERGTQALSAEQDRIKQLYQLAEQSLTKEQRMRDEEIRQKRELLREEMSVLRTRLEAARAETEMAMGRRERVIDAAGRMSKEDFTRTLDIAKRINAGAGPEQLSKADREFILSNQAVFGRVNRAFAHNQFFAKGGQELLNLEGAGFRFNQEAFDLSRKQAKATRELANVAADSIFKAELNIDQVVAEIKGLEDNLAEVLAPIIKDFIDRSVRDIQKKLDEGRIEQKVGNAQGAF